MVGSPIPLAKVPSIVFNITSCLIARCCFSEKRWLVKCRLGILLLALKVEKAPILLKTRISWITCKICEFTYRFPSVMLCRSRLRLRLDLLVICSQSVQMRLMVEINSTLYSRQNKYDDRFRW